MKRVAFGGGGTGGHTMTVLAMVDLLASSGSLVNAYWFVTDGLDSTVAIPPTITRVSVHPGKIRRGRPMVRNTLRNLAGLAKTTSATFETVRSIRNLRPDCCIVTGGYGAVPVGIAALLCRIPLVVHEQTASMGLANRLLVRWARHILLSFDESREFVPQKRLNRVSTVGCPVRETVARGSIERFRSRYLPAQTGKPLLLVLGGSQGATQINELVADSIEWLSERYVVVHQTGMNQSPAREHVDYLRFAFIEDIGDALATAAVVLSRSGAGTCAELQVTGTPAVLVPYPHSAGDEQMANARALERLGLAVVLGTVNSEALREAVEAAARLGRRPGDPVGRWRAINSAVATALAGLQVP